MKTAVNEQDEDEAETNEEDIPMETDKKTEKEVENFLHKFLINSESSGLMDSIDLRLMLTALF